MMLPPLPKRNGKLDTLAEAISTVTVSPLASKLPPLKPYVKTVIAASADEPLDEDEYAKHKSSKKENYCTPASFLEVVTELGPIGLDPCSNEHALTCATTEYRLDKGQDGLVLPWEGHGLVFCNPPYGKKTAVWIKRMREMAQRGVEIVGLVGGRADTAWLQDCGAQLICFWRGRLMFLDGDTGMPCVDKHGKATGAIFPQAVLYYGTRLDAFTELFTFAAKKDRGKRGGKVVPWEAPYKLV